jgi:tetratricopeptide (TPR) repeat protein
VADENWHDAVAHLRHYLESYPEDVEALAACAKALVEGYNEPEQAFELYQTIIDVNYYDHDARRRLVALAIQLGKTDAAINNSRILLDRFPSDADVAYLAGKTAESDNRPQDALRLYIRATRFDALHAGANRRLAVLYEVLYANRNAVALAIERLEQSEDQSFESILTLAEYYISRDQVDVADDLVSQLMDQQAGQSDRFISGTRVAIRLAARHANQRNVQKVEAILQDLEQPLQQATDQQPQSVFFDMSLAQLQTYAGQHEKSLDTLRTAITRVPQNLDLRFQLSWQLIKGKQHDSAEDSIAHLLKIPNSPEATVEKYANVLTAVATLQRGDVAAAAKLLQNAIEEGVEPAVVAGTVCRIQASCSEQLADWDAAVEAWRRVLRFEPGNRTARLSLSLSLFASERYSEGMRNLNTIPRLGETLQKSLDRPSGLADCKQADQLSPRCVLPCLLSDEDATLKPRARVFLTALVLTANGEHAAAHQAVNARDDIQERLFELVALTSSADVVELSVLKKIVDIDQHDARPISALLLAKSAGGELDQVKTLIDQRLTGLAEPQWVKAAGVLASGIAGAARSLRKSNPKKAQQLDKFAGSLLEEMVKYDRGRISQMVEFHISAARFEEAIQCCRRGWAEFPARLAPLWLAAAQQHPKPQESLADLESAFKKSFENGSRSVSNSGQSVSAALFSGRTDNPVRHDGRRTGPDHAQVGLALGDLYLMTERFALAESVYRRVLKMQPDQINALNNTSWLLAVQKRELQLAADFVQRAIQIAGERPDLLDTRGCVRLAQGDTAAARNDFTKAIQLGAGTDSMFHLAVALQRSGQRDASRRVLEEARNRGFDPENISALEQHFVAELAN